MSSERLRQANRANAARSTGPRSRAGRAKAARNARRYGLSLPVMADAALAPEVAALARRKAALRDFDAAGWEELKLKVAK